jgi:hypothetical protein
VKTIFITIKDHNRCCILTTVTYYCFWKPTTYGKESDQRSYELQLVECIVIVVTGHLDEGKLRDVRVAQSRRCTEDEDLLLTSNTHVMKKIIYPSPLVSIKNKYQQLQSYVASLPLLIIFLLKMSLNQQFETIFIITCIILKIRLY